MSGWPGGQPLERARGIAEADPPTITDEQQPFALLIRPPSFGSPLPAESVAADRVDPACIVSECCRQTEMGLPSGDPESP